MKEEFFDVFPIDDVPKGVNVIGPAILVIEIVGVFPYVEKQNRTSFGEGNVLVGR
jgi:hypothetical protein